MIQWRCSCGYIGNTDIGYWMRCDNPNCNSKNAFQIISLRDDIFEERVLFNKRLFDLELRLKELEGKK